MKGAHENNKESNKEALNPEENAAASKAFDELTSKMLKEGQTPQKTMGLSQNIMESMYAQAYRLYHTGKYFEATHLFRILIMMNAMEPKYLLGLAACFHMLKEYENAIQTYSLCSTLEPESPIPHYHSSDCFIQMNNHFSAMISLEMTITRCGDKPEYSKIKERALMGLESLKQQVSSKGGSHE